MKDNYSIDQQKALAMAAARRRRTEAGAQKEQPQAPVSAGRTALDQGLQGATFGFADEITDRAGAGIAGLFTSEKYDDLLKEARGMSKERLNAEMQQRPGLSITSNLAGGLLTGGAGATTKTGTAIANSLRSGNTAARVTKGAVAGATSGGLYGAGSAEDGERLEGAGKGAALGGAFGAAIPIAGAAVNAGVKGSQNAWKGVFARTGEDLQKIGQQIKDKASSHYKVMRESGAVINPNSGKRLISAIDNALLSTGKNNPRLHGDTISVIDDLKAASQSGRIGLEELDQFRQLLGEVVSKNTDAIKGINPDALKASRAIEALDDIVEKFSAKDIRGGNTDAINALNMARQEWKKYRKFESISNIIRRADGDPNKLKSGLQAFVLKKKNLQGFSKEERVALVNAARNSGGEKLLKALGKFGFDLGASLTPGNTFLPVASSLAGGAGVPGGIPLAVGGTAARQAQKYVGRAKIEDVLKMIESGNNTKGLSLPSTGKNAPKIDNKKALIASMLLGQPASY